MSLDSIAESLLDGIVTVGYALASLLLTGAGLDAEYLGMTYVGEQTVLGLWLGFVGLLAIGAGMLLLRDRVLPRVRGGAA